MVKQKKLILTISSVALVSSIALAAVFLSANALTQNVKATEYTLVIDKDNKLDGGDTHTRGGTTIHFDEYGVNENIDDALLELAAYGNVALQTYISGIKEARVYSAEAADGDFFLSVGATPNSAEFTVPSFQGESTAYLDGGYEGDVFYFAVHNKKDTPLKIDRIEIDYSCVDGEKALRDLIDEAIAESPEHVYDGNPFNPYSGHEINPSSIPEDRVLIQTMDSSEYPTAPGNYIYGYEVYDTDNEGNARKLLYTRTNTFSIVGDSREPFDPFNEHVLTFHIPDNNGNEQLVYKTTTSDSFDLKNLPTECYPYNWESPYNKFTNIGDEHYYPVFNVLGISPNKEGDGCLPVSKTYSYLERGFTMPEPVMKSGYRFGGWFLDEECEHIFDPNKMHPGNLVLYAKCLETTDFVRIVYYHNEDGTLSDHVDYLKSNDEVVNLPAPADIIPNLRVMSPYPLWSLFIGDNYIDLYLTPDFGHDDKIKYSDFTSRAGEIHVYATELKTMPYDDWSYDLITQDIEENHIFQHTLMASKYRSETDFLVHSIACKERADGPHYLQDSFPVDRTGNFFVTDEKKAYIYDSGTLKNMTSHTYGNISMKKPLSGILRHESVRKVGRRAFFNRYGLKGTYFPKNAVEFDIEAYSNVTFNNILTLPKSLTKIGDRCFMGSDNIKFVCLPRTIKSIGLNAFSYGEYNPETRVFENIESRSDAGEELITFLYEGSESDFNRLDDESKAAITANAKEIIYNYEYQTYYGR